MPLARSHFGGKRRDSGSDKEREGEEDLSDCL